MFQQAQAKRGVRTVNPMAFPISFCRRLVYDLQLPMPTERIRSGGQRTRMSRVVIETREKALRRKLLLNLSK